MELEVVQPLLDAITAKHEELAKHVASWTSRFNPIIPVLTQLFPFLIHYSRNYACAQSYRLFSKLCRHNRRTPTHDILAKQSEVDNYSY